MFKLMTCDELCSKLESLGWPDKTIQACRRRKMDGSGFMKLLAKIPPTFKFDEIEESQLGLEPQRNLEKLKPEVQQEIMALKEQPPSRTSQPASFSADPATAPRATPSQPVAFITPPNVPKEVVPEKSSGTFTTLPSAQVGPSGSDATVVALVSGPKITLILVVEDEFNINNYGTYKVEVFGTDNSTIVLSTQLSIQPKDSIKLAENILIRDSVNTPISGCQVILTSESDQSTRTFAANSEGVCALPSNTPDGIYTGKIKSGAVESVFRVVVVKGLRKSEEHFFIARQIKSQEEEIVLRWGSSPRDLDSHLFSNKGAHVYYSNRKQGNISLDCDVTSGNGPETIKFTLEADTKYIYAVYRFSSDGTLPESGAKVFFASDGNTIEVSSLGNIYANLWVVCSIDGTTGTRKIINKFVDSFSSGNSIDPALFSS